MRVLSVEDSPIMQDMIAATLETKGGYRVEFADDGARGLAMLEQGLRKFDCILVDVHLPDMTGIEFTEKARALRGYDETPLIVVTKSDDEATVVDAFCAGATDFLAKPFRPAELIARLSVARPQLHRNGTGTQGGRAEVEPATAGITAPAYRSSGIFLNFLQSLNQNQVRKTTILAVDHQVAGHLAETPQERDSVLRCVVNAMVRVFDSRLVICASVSGHQVVAALSARPADTSLALSHKLVERICRTNRTAHRWTPGIVVGNPITPSMFFADEPVRLLERAVQSAESRRNTMDSTGAFDRHSEAATERRRHVMIRTAGNLT